MNIWPIILMCLLAIVGLFLGKTIIRLGPVVSVGMMVALVGIIITTIKTDFGLILLIFSMLLSPEIPVAQVPQRAVVIRYDDILVVTIFFTWLAKLAINKELGLLRSTPLNLPIAVYILICILSTSLGIITGRVSSATSSFYILKYIEYFMLYFMFVNNIRNKRQIKTFITALLVTCAIVCLFGYYQIGGGVGRVTAPFEGEHGEPNTLGGYLVLMLGLTIGLLLYSSSPRERLLLGGLACFIIPVFLKTLSRGSYLAFLPMYFTLVLLSNKKVILLGALAIAIPLGALTMPQSVFDRIEYTFIPGMEYKAGGVEFALDYSSSARVRTWKGVLTKSWPAKPFLGHGITGVGLVDSQYVRVLGELGVIGFAVFIWLLVTIFKQGIRSFRSSEQDGLAQGLSLGFLAGFVGILITAIPANVFIIVRIMEPFWFLAAVVMMLPTIESGSASVPVESEERMRR